MLIREIMLSLGIKSRELPEKKLKIKGLSLDSRAVSKDYCFIAVKGTDSDGHDFIDKALDEGAALVIYDKTCSEKIKKISQPERAVFIGVDEPRAAAAKLAAEFFHNPSRRLKITGITGTNGKTTVSFLIEHIFKANSINAGIIGTIHYKIAGHIIEAGNTTPDVVTLEYLLYLMLEHDLTHAVMEVSSHALDQRRVEGVEFKTALFTNLTHEHLDYHQSLEKYFAAKVKLFENLTRHHHAVINIDDVYGMRLKQMTKAEIVDYAIENKNARITALDIRLKTDSAEFTIKAGKDRVRVKTELIGRHNIYNMLAAAGVALVEGIPLKSIASALETFKAVPGRLECVGSGLPFKIFIDYAHTDDAVKNVLDALRELHPKKIIAVFGCGGNRDRKKRPLMGKLASQKADFLVITNDNPRNENPEDIVQDIKQGFSAKFDNYQVILDRKQAIASALAKAEPGDFVLIAGKGHERYQIFKDKKIHFDDREVVQEILKLKK